MVEKPGMRERVYADEPILRTAISMMKTMPSRYTEMRRISIRNDLRPMTSQEIFYRQGLYMADFEDDYPEEASFFRYYPTYQSMSDSQLRTYFTWRAKVRRGDVQLTSLSYAFVYVYELINCIGVETPQEAFEKLVRFREAYARMDSRMEPYFANWLRDFAVYYHLDPSVLHDLVQSEHDSALSVLLNAQEETDDALYEAINFISGYKPKNSRLAKQEPEKMKSAVCHVYRAMDAYSTKHKNITLCEQMFGRIYASPYVMFGSVPFYDRIPRGNYTYKVTELYTVSHSEDGWTSTHLWGKKGGGAELGTLMKAVDCELRKRLHYPHLLKDVPMPQYERDIICHAFDTMEAEEKRSRRREIKFDFSKLQGIRETAEETKEKLIVDEADMEIPDEPSVPAPEPPQPEAKAVPNPFNLTETEMQVLRLLMEGKNPEPDLRKKGVLLSVVTDSINEKCFDTFGDTVLVYESDLPEVVEDYMEELKGMICI